jgi:hypothetical protein
VPGIKVKYDPDTQKFKFHPFAFTVWEKGNVELTRLPPNAEWKFVRATFKNDPSGQFIPRVAADGKSIDIEDRFLFEDPDIYYYTVTIQFDGKPEITSPDPVIVNDPGGSGFDTEG